MNPSKLPEPFEVLMDLEVALLSQSELEEYIRRYRARGVTDVAHLRSLKEYCHHKKSHGQVTEDFGAECYSCGRWLNADTVNKLRKGRDANGNLT